MTYFKSLADDAGVRHILALNKPAGRALIAFHEAVLRQPSALSPGDRELIAAYVSALNQCEYCFGVHSETARHFGVAVETLSALIADVDSAPVDPRMKPLLRYARTLTLTPSRIKQADAAAVFAAGWTEQALHDAVMVVCLFNFMNRLLDGHGAHGNADVFATRGKALHDGGYSPLLKLLGD